MTAQPEPRGRIQADRQPWKRRENSSLLSDADGTVRGQDQLDSGRAHRIEALARQLLRHESLASSRIEGLAVSHKRISAADHDPRGTGDQRAREVLGNIEAMERAIHIGSGDDPISDETILDLRRTLMTPTQPKIAGIVRDRQN